MIERNLPPLLERCARLYVAVKLVAFAAFAVSLAFATTAEAEVSFGGGAVAKDEAPVVLGDPTVCTGENLVHAIGRENPDAMARIDARAAAIPHGTGKFFRLEKAGIPPSHVYGTMHVADERATDLMEAVSRGIEEADHVALEIKEIADPAALQAKIGALTAKVLYLDGTTLGSRLSPRDVQMLQSALAARGPVPWAAAQRMRPWMLMAAMSVPACENARKQAGRPIVDRIIADLATGAGREVVGLETVESQVSTIAGLPEPLMLRALVDVARLGARMDDVFETTVALYESGETAKIWALLQDPVVAGGSTDKTDGASEAERAAGYAAFQENVIDRRNKTMVEALEPLMTKGNAFAGIGALHLPGEKGMLRLLEARGWTVTRLD